jgi:uncharacterized protein (TIGR03546 family)
MFMRIIFSPSTPAQLILVSLLGFIFGFIPGFGYSPLLFVGVILLVLLLRVNIGLFVIIAFFAKLLSYPLEIVSFSTGKFLVDGFTQPIFKAAVNTPVLAYAGFEYYLVTGALFVAIVLGLILGIIIAKIYKKFISKLANVQAGSELYQKMTNKLSVKIASKIIFGKNISKVDWQKIQSRKFRQPIRIWGLTLVILAIVGLAYAPTILETAMVSNIIKQQLTKANGATVDYDSLKLDLADAKLQISGLGAADPKNLDKDRFYAANISASLDISGLLVKQIALKDVVVDGVSLDKQRASRGELYSNPEQAKIIDSKDNTQTADEFMKYAGDKFQQVNINEINKKATKTADTAKSIKQAAEVLAKFRPSPSEDTSNDKQNAVIKQEAEVYGYADVKNDTLRDKAPEFTIYNMNIKNYVNDGVTYEAKIINLSTAPEILAKPTSIDVKSVSNNDLDVKIVISNQPRIDNTVSFDLKNLAGDSLKGLTIKGVGIDADNLDVSGNGKWHFAGINNVGFNIPLNLKLNNVGINLGKVKQKLSNLSLKAILSGNLNDVGFAIDTSSITQLFSTDNIKNTATQLIDQSGLDSRAKEVLNKATNGKSLNTEDLKNTVNQLVDNSNLDSHTKELLNNATVNGKSLKEMNAKDVKDLASKFGVSF